MKDSNLELIISTSANIDNCVVSNEAARYTSSIENQTEVQSAISNRYYNKIINSSHLICLKEIQKINGRLISHESKFTL